MKNPMTIPNPTSSPSSRDPRYILAGILIFLLVIVMLLKTRKPKDSGEAARQWTTREMKALGTSLDNALGTPGKSRDGK